MNTLIVYDSVYGNTEQTALAIGNACGSEGEVHTIRVGDLRPEQLKGLSLLIVGSPTQGGRPTPAIQEFFNEVPAPAIEGVRAAAFDTRLSTRWVGIFGYAAGRIASRLKGKGATLVAPPEAFFVRDKEGPLKDGELERAADWARLLMKA